MTLYSAKELRVLFGVAGGEITRRPQIGRPSGSKACAIAKFRLVPIA
jgi:hypothetical protein